MSATIPKVYAAIAAVTKALAESGGISKDRSGTGINYKFRGIDDVYNALAPLLAEHGLVVLPRTLSRECVERTTRNGGALFYVTVSMEFDFVGVADGSKHTVAMFGEAMDSSDKATNKAQSAAYKYACMQAFCIPTEGDNDADARTHEVRALVPAGFDDWFADMDALAGEGSVAALRDAWSNSKPEYQKHASTVERERWAALKAKAAKVPVPA